MCHCFPRLVDVAICPSHLSLSVSLHELKSFKNSLEEAARNLYISLTIVPTLHHCLPEGFHIGVWAADGI